MMNSKKTKTKWSFFVFFVPVFLWMVLTFVLPQFDLLRMSFLGTDYYGESGITLDNYIAFFKENVYWLTFVRTAGYSILVTGIAIIIALPVSFYISKVAKEKLQRLLIILTLLPFWVSGLVRVYGVMTLLRESGVINRILLSIGLLEQPIEMLFNDRAMVFTLVYTNILFMIVPVLGVMDTLDNALIEAAYDLGAKKPIIWLKIIIPHCMPGITGGSIIVFMFVMGSYITPTLIGGKNSVWFTQQIYNQFIDYFNWNQGAAFGLLLLMVSSMVILTALKLTGQKLSEVME